MKKIFILMGLCIMFTMQSCSSESEPMMEEPNEVNIEISHMVVKFGDKIYETDVKTVGDSVQYLNGDYAEVFDTEISKIKDGATLLYTDENGVSYVEYFHSEKELVEKYEFIEQDSLNTLYEFPVTRAKIIDIKPSSTPIIAMAELYDDKYFDDTELIVYATTIEAATIQKLSDIGFNDKASSIKLYNKLNPYETYSMGHLYGSNLIKYQSYLGSQLRPVLTCYHNSFYKGAVLYCISSPSGSQIVHSDSDLKTIGWNDRISSLKWKIVTDFSEFEKQGDEEPKIPRHDEC